MRSYIFSLINILYIKRVKKENRRTWKWCSGQVEDFRAQFKYQLAASAQISASQCQLQCIGLVRFTRNSWDTVSTMNSHPKVYGCPRQNCRTCHLRADSWKLNCQLLKPPSSVLLPLNVCKGQRLWPGTYCYDHFIWCLQNLLAYIKLDQAYGILLSFAQSTHSK